MTPSKKPAVRKEATPPAGERRQRGRVDRGAMFPVPAPASEMPADYAAWLAEIKTRIQGERLRLVLASNSVMVMLYWDIGRRILQKQAEQGYGARVIDRLAADLRDAFPEMKGFSPRNLKYMRAFAAAWPDAELVQRTVAQLTWGQNIALLEKLDQSEDRLWYAARTLEHGWSRDILSLQIKGQAHLRHSKAQNNFPATLPPHESDMAAQLFKDPYLFDFLGTAAPRREAELEIGDDDFYLDLLFYHLKLRRYVVIELKARKFEPGEGAQLGMYMTAVDRLLAHPDKPTLGLLLVREKNRVLVEYALSGSTQPISVAEWETQLTRALPSEFQGSLPTIEEIEAELSGDVGRG
jgi:predicted nuclease of restriction endonuclease-like (RecB) superfamily